MPLLTRVLGAPLAVDIRRGAVGDLAPLLADGRISAHGDVAIALGPGLGEEIVGQLPPVLTGHADVFRVSGGGVDSARALVEQLGRRSYDAVVGIGGGRTLDVAKYAATMVGLPMVAVATNLAHDGLASPVASLEHCGRKGSYGVQIPIAVVVDLDYVLRSPPAQRRGGIGDAVSNLSAVADWELARQERGERVDGLAVSLARTSGEAVLGSAGDIDSGHFLTTLAEALVLSGLAMAVAGSSRPCSGGCHEISHAMDLLFPGTGSHGEQVAVGTLFTFFLREDPVVADIDACLRRHGLPRVPADLGLSDGQFAEAVAHAPATRPDRYTILEHLDLGLDDIRKRVDEFLFAFDR
jgi:glycerol-1-phosphate dehydrogenase [NAD(P)+]